MIVAGSISGLYSYNKAQPIIINTGAPFAVLHFGEKLPSRPLSLDILVYMQVSRIDFFFATLESPGLIGTTLIRSLIFFSKSGDISFTP